MIKEAIREKMYEAMKKDNKTEKKIYSQALDAILKEEKKKNVELNDNDCIAVLRKEIKQYNETITYALSSKHLDMVKECEDGIKLLNEFMPKMMTEEEIRTWIQASIPFNNTKSEKGRWMGMCSKGLKGKADMSLVSKIVDSMLV